MAQGLARRWLLPASGVLALGVVGCGNDSHALLQAQVSLSGCTSSLARTGSPTAQSMKVMVSVTNSATPGPIGTASNEWPATFVLVDTGPNLSLQDLSGKKNTPPQQIDAREFAFNPLKAGKSHTLTAVLKAIKPGTATLTVSAWGGDDPWDVPPAGKPSIGTTAVGAMSKRAVAACSTTIR